MANKKRINGLIDGDVVDAVAKAAKDDSRSVSLMMEILLRKSLIEAGYLQPKKK